MGTQFSKLSLRPASHPRVSVSPRPPPDASASEQSGHSQGLGTLNRLPGEIRLLIYEEIYEIDEVTMTWVFFGDGGPRICRIHENSNIDHLSAASPSFANECRHLRRLQDNDNMATTIEWRFPSTKFAEYFWDWFKTEHYLNDEDDTAACMQQVQDDVATGLYDKIISCTWSLEWSRCRIVIDISIRYNVFFAIQLLKSLGATMESRTLILVLNASSNVVESWDTFIVDWRVVRKHIISTELHFYTNDTDSRSAESVDLLKRCEGRIVRRPQPDPWASPRWLLDIPDELLVPHSNHMP